MDRRAFVCSGCHATLALDPGAITETCPFCSSHHVSLHESLLPTTPKPTEVLPFAVTREQAAEHVAEWLETGRFHPPGFVRMARLGQLQGVYLPYWSFAADVACHWSGRIGTETTKTETDPNGRRIHTTQIRWRPASGSFAFAIYRQLVRGTSRVSGDVLTRLEGQLDLAQSTAYDPSFLPGFQAFVSEVSFEDACRRARPAMLSAASSACRSSLSEPHVDGFRMDATFTNEAWRHVLVPVWVGSFRWRDESFVVLVDGRTGYVAGRRPIDQQRLWLATLAILTPALVLLGVGVVTMPFGVGLPILGLGGLTLLLAAYGAWRLHSRVAGLDDDG